MKTYVVVTDFENIELSSHAGETLSRFQAMARKDQRYRAHKEAKRTVARIEEAFACLAEFAEWSGTSVRGLFLPDARAPVATPTPVIMAPEDL